METFKNKSNLFVPSQHIRIYSFCNCFFFSVANLNYTILMIKFSSYLSAFVGYTSVTLHETFGSRTLWEAMQCEYHLKFGQGTDANEESVYIAISTNAAEKRTSLICSRCKISGFGT